MKVHLTLRFKSLTLRFQSLTLRVQSKRSHRCQKSVTFKILKDSLLRLSRILPLVVTA